MCAQCGCFGRIRGGYFAGLGVYSIFNQGQVIVDMLCIMKASVQKDIATKRGLSEFMCERFILWGGLFSSFLLNAVYSWSVTVYNSLSRVRSSVIPHALFLLSFGS
jgi:hypothetical protein